MSLSSSLPASAVELVIGLLVRLVLPNVADPAAARALVIGMLADYEPRTGRELRLAGEIVGCSLNALQAQSDAGQRDLQASRLADIRRFASTVGRTGMVLEKHLEALQRHRRAGVAEARGDGGSTLAVPEIAARGETLSPAAPAAAQTPTAAQRPADPAMPAVVPSPVVPSPVVPLPVVPLPVVPLPVAPLAAVSPAAAPPAVVPPATLAPEPSVPPADQDAAPIGMLAEAEASCTRAERLLHMMKARWKGAPPPHSKAGQDIQAQQRVVNGARMKLQQARRQAAVVAGITA